MNTHDFLRLLEEVIEAPANTLIGGELLEGLPQWDSLAVLSFMAKIDEVLNMQLSADAIVKAKSVADLQALLPAG